MPLQQIYSSVFEQVSAGNGGAYPIPPAYYPDHAQQVLAYNAIIIGAVSATARPNWDLGAWVQFVKEVDAGIDVASNRYPALLNQHYVRLDPPSWFDTYRLYFTFPTWLQAVNLVVFAETP